MPVPLAPYPTPPAPALSPSQNQSIPLSPSQNQSLVWWIQDYPRSPFVYSTWVHRSTGGQSQLVCSGCRNLLMYPVGAISVCCAVCNAVTAVPPPGTEMAQLVCGGCHTLLMYIRGATSVQCSCCHTVTLALEANQVAHVNCGGCRMLLMYQYGARSVKCAVCSFVTSVGGSTSTTDLKLNS